MQLAPLTSALALAVLLLGAALILAARRRRGPGRRNPGRRNPGRRPDTALPDDALPDDALDDLPLRAARDAAVRGDWRPAADLLASTPDAEQRSDRVVVLAATAVDHGTWLDHWLDASMKLERPGDPDALVVRAETGVARAWRLRGTAWRPRNHHAFVRALTVADDHARQAAVAAPGDPSPHMTRLRVARGLEVGRDEFARRLSALTALAPHHRPALEQALQYKTAKWGGSAAEMFAFARRVSADAPAGSSAALLVVWAHLEHGATLDRRGSSRGTAYLADPATRAEIAAAEERWSGRPGPAEAGRAWGHNVLAYAWWLARDPDAARPHLARTREHLATYPWAFSGDPTAVHARAQAWVAACRGATTVTGRRARGHRVRL